jgi:hypothetical protein
VIWLFVLGATKVQRLQAPLYVKRGTSRAEGIGQQTNNMASWLVFFAAVSTCFAVIHGAIGRICLFSEFLLLEISSHFKMHLFGKGRRTDRERLVYL